MLLNDIALMRCVVHTRPGKSVLVYMPSLDLRGNTHCYKLMRYRRVLRWLNAWSGYLPFGQSHCFKGALLQFCILLLTLNSSKVS